MESRTHYQGDVTTSPSETARTYDETCRRLEEEQSRDELLALSGRIAKDLSLNAADLLWLSRQSSVTLRSGVAANPNTPARLLHSLSQSVVPLIRAATASNPFVTTDSLTSIALREKDPQVLSAVARHPMASPDTLMLVLAAAPDAEVRLRVAENLSCDRGTLMFLADDEENPEVLAAVGAHPNAPEPLREAIKRHLNA